MIHRKIRSTIKSSNRLFMFLKKRSNLQNGFSMLEAVVVVGVLLALAVGGFLSYGQITESAKIAKVKSIASEVYTAVMVAQVDGDSSTKAKDIVDQYNESQNKIRVDLRAGSVDQMIAAMSTETYEPKSDNDFCIIATNLENPDIFSEMGACNEGSEDPDPNIPPSKPIYIDPTPTKTILTYRCDVRTSGNLPLKESVNGTETWSDGLIKNYINAPHTFSRTLEPNVTYTMTFDGTYNKVHRPWSDSGQLESCLRSIDHWGQETGVTDATYGFIYSVNLTSVPEYIPHTITNMDNMLTGAGKLNDPNISKWDVSNVANMSGLFRYATVFDQPLNEWKVNKVTNMSSMFSGASKFNQPLDKWYVGEVLNMSNMFHNSTSFDQTLNSWNVSSVTNMGAMFYSAIKFNQSLDRWNVSQVTSMAQMFEGAISFNGDIMNWKTGNVQGMTGMFDNATAFNRNISHWDTSSFVAISTRFADSATFPRAHSPKNTRLDY
jgi:surface protein